MRRSVVWVTAMVLVAACHRQAKPEPTPPVSATRFQEVSSPTPAPLAPEPLPAQRGVARPATAGEQATIAQLSRAAESVRQLRLLRPVTTEIEDGQAIVNSLRSQIEESEIERARLIYGALGLIDPDEDLQSLFSAVLGEQVIGYYDPDTGRLVVRDDVMEGLSGEFGPEQMQEARLVLVHELVHALQDQRLGLGASYEEERTADADNAFRSVVEGDATLAMLAHALRQQGIPLSAATAGIQQMGDLVDLDGLVRGEKLDEAPAILRVTLVAPYIRGVQFVAAVQARGGWPAVNNAHRDPPTTTEQILHPEKFFAHEHGEPIEVPDNEDLLAAGFERAAEDTLGELELGVYLGQDRPSGTNDRAAQGWGGDRLVVYVRGSERVVVWWTTWDTEEDAKEAYQAARALSERRGEVRVERKDRSVLILHRIPLGLERSVKSDFFEFARRIKNLPPPPLLQPTLRR